METIPTTSRSLDRYYHIKGDTFEKQYKEILSSYRGWSELSHAEEWLVFPENLGESICIDETAPSNGELYTIVTNRASHGGKGTIIAIVKGVAADAVTETLMRIDENKRLMVKEITMDMSKFPQCHTDHRPLPYTETRLRCLAGDAYRPQMGRHSGRHGCQRGSQRSRQDVHSRCTCKRRHAQTAAGTQQIPAFQVCRQMDTKSKTKSRGPL